MSKKIDSKYLSYILRHKPEEAGLTLDDFGYADVAKLCKALKITEEELEHMVADNTRYVYNKDHTKVKAAHGHSVPVKYEHSEEPPTFLYHGTADRFMASIQEIGLQPQTRDMVHMSNDYYAAHTIALRHTGGSVKGVVILQIHAKHMYQDGYEFYKSEDGVWLTESVPYKYIEIAQVG